MQDETDIGRDAARVLRYIATIVPDHMDQAAFRIRHVADGMNFMAPEMRRSGIGWMKLNDVLLDVLERPNKCSPDWLLRIGAIVANEEKIPEDFEAK